MKRPKTSSFLIAILILSVTLRLAAAFYLGDSVDLPRQARIYDQVSYNALAKSILAGHGYSFDRPWYPFGLPAGTPTAHWSFIYPLFLAVVYGIAGYHPLAARILQALISGILMPLLVYRLGRRLFGQAVGLAAAGLLAVYAYWVYHDAALMTETFFTLGVLASLRLGIELAGPGHSSRQLPRIHIWLAFGLVLGLTALLRQTILLWLPFLFGYIAWNRPNLAMVKGLAAAAAVAAALILPWTFRNALVYDGAFLPLNSNAGYALYSSQHPDHGIDFDQAYAAPLPEDLIHADPPLNEAQWNNALTARGVGFILANPSRYLLLSLDRIPIFFSFWFSPESDLLSNLMRLLSFGLYLPCYLFGIFLSVRQVMETKSRQPLFQRLILSAPGPVLLFALVFSLLHILTWASIRYRLPIDAALMPFAGLALLYLWERIRSGRRKQFNSKFRRHQVS